MIWTLEGIPSVRAANFLGLASFSTSTMDAKLLKEAISDSIENIPVGLQWKTISIRSQGSIPKEQQVKLHIYVNELDVNMAKPLLTALYASKMGARHIFPLHICMCLILELDAVLNTKGQVNVDKLQACQNMWTLGKLITIKTWEIELLNDESKELGMSLWDAVMELQHPTNKNSTYSTASINTSETSVTSSQCSNQPNLRHMQ